MSWCGNNVLRLGEKLLLERIIYTQRLADVKLCGFPALAATEEQLQRIIRPNTQNPPSPTVAPSMREPN